MTSSVSHVTLTSSYEILWYLRGLAHNFSINWGIVKLLFVYELCFFMYFADIFFKLKNKSMYSKKGKVISQS